MTLYDDANKMTKEAMDNTLKSMSIMTKGFQQIATESTDFAKRSFEQQSAAIEKMAQSKSMEKSVQVQTEYAKAAYQNWIGQATRMGELYSGIAKDAYQPFEKTAANARDMGLKTADEASQTVKRAAEAAPKKAA